MPALDIEPVLSSTRATRRRVLPQVETEVALKSIWLNTDRREDGDGNDGHEGGDTAPGVREKTGKHAASPNV